MFIDYLQILAPWDQTKNLTDKQNVDKNILELKKMSRDLDVAVVCISSLNRESYERAISTASFKESGAIEYSSDVLIGMTYEVPKSKDDKSYKEAMQKAIDASKEKARKGEPFGVEVSVLKNRNGYKDNLVLDFIPKYNYFSSKSDVKDPVKEFFDS